ncbi:MAG: ABC transporter substrate-binding protein [Terriglobia bacterium]|jgi:putative ABC transport system substrate-binding protein
MSASRVALTLLRRLGLGLSIIALASLALLLSDWKHSYSRAGMPRLAVVKYNSNPNLDLGVRGLIDSLRDHGWVDGHTVEVRFFCPEGDVGTLNSTAQELVSGKFTHVITISTPCLQALAKANRDGKVKHIFGVVADPLAARVGINPTNPYDHPKWMVGIGTFMPVGELLEMARRLNPRLRSVGLPWNPAEANSQSYTHVAREAAGRLGLELLEGNVENSTAVGEVTDSLIARGAEAILMTGDNTVSLASDTVLARARKARIPAMATAPTTVGHGALFAIGADYYQVGRQLGDLAARVLSGEDPATMPILYQIPKIFRIDRRVPAQLRDAWVFPPDVLAQAKDVSANSPPGARR